MVDYGRCAELADDLREHEDIRDMFTGLMHARKAANHARLDDKIAEREEEFNEKYSKTIGFVLQETGLPDLVDMLGTQEEVRAAFKLLLGLSRRFTNLEKKEPAKLKMKLDEAIGMAISGILFQAGTAMIARGEEVPDSIALGPRPEGSILKRGKRDHNPPKEVRVDEANNTVEYFPSGSGVRLKDRNQAKEVQEAIEKLQAQEGTQPARKKRGPPTPIPPEQQAEAIKDWPAPEAGPVDPATESDEDTVKRSPVSKEHAVNKPAPVVKGAGKTHEDRGSQTDLTFAPRFHVTIVVTESAPIPADPQADPAPAPQADPVPAPAPQADPVPAPAPSAPALPGSDMIDLSMEDDD